MSEDNMQGSFGECVFCNKQGNYLWYGFSFCEKCLDKYRNRTFEKGQQAIIKEIEIIKQEILKVIDEKSNTGNNI